MHANTTLNVPLSRHQSRNYRLQDSIGQSPKTMFADSVKRNLLGFLPVWKTPDHFIVGVSPGKVRELYVDDLGDFPLGDLPTSRYRDARKIRKHAVAGRSR